MTATAIGDGITESARNHAKRAGRAASSEMKNFMSDVEELVAKIGDVKDAEVARLRTKLQSSIESAKDDVAGTTENLRRRAREAASTADEYVRGSPWQAMGIAALLGLALGYAVSRRF